MAFEITGFTVATAAKRGSAPSVYAYKTTDALSAVRAAGYFNDLADTLQVGDLVYCVTSAGGTAVASLNYVLSNTGGVVDVNDGTVLANTDTD